MKKKSKKPTFKKFALSVLNNKYYLKISILVLSLASIVWSFVSTNVSVTNYTQLSFSYQFINLNNLKNTYFSSNQSSLLKWPIYWIISLFNYSHALFYIFSISLTLVTILFLAQLIRKIEKRPQVLGTIYLCLASIILMIPIQSYYGAADIINMASIYTLNIEFILYIVAFRCIMGANRFYNKLTVISILVLSVLFASNKVFIVIAIGSAILGISWFVSYKKWKIVNKYNNTLLVALLAVVGSNLIIYLINSINLTHLFNGGLLDNKSFINGFSDLPRSMFWSVSGLLTNFGANPITQSFSQAGLGAQIKANVSVLNLFSYLFNLSIFVGCIYLSYKMVLENRRKALKKEEINLILVILSLISSLIVVIVLEFITKQSSPNSSVIFLIGLFSLVLASAAFMAKRKPSLIKTSILLVGSALSIILGSVNLYHNYHKYNANSSETKTSSARIIFNLKLQNIKKIVGDKSGITVLKYYDNYLTLNPINDCSNNSALAYKFNKTPFGLLYEKKSGKNLPNCTIKQITDIFGKPGYTVLLKGSYANPEKQLFIYANGINHPGPVSPKKLTNTILTSNLSDLLNTTCSGPTIMNIVAHQDDDILFMNPDIQKDLSLGRCLRTIYLTAGDSGNNADYWYLREAGSEKAYSKMLNIPTTNWYNHTVKIADNQYVQIANPVNNKNVSLIFFLLPDGNLNGQGFAANGFQSLAKLYNASIPTINSVDKQSYYSKNQLINAIYAVFGKYLPTEIRTQNPNAFGDHSDHVTTGKFATDAYNSYESIQFNNLDYLPFIYYTGYPIRSLPINLSANDTKIKTEIFKAYIQSDFNTCKTIESCLASNNYGGYLNKEYLQKIHE